MKMLQVERRKIAGMIAIVSACLLFAGGCSNADVSDTVKTQNKSAQSIEAEAADKSEASVPSEAALQSEETGNEQEAGAETEQEVGNGQEAWAETEQQDVLPANIELNLGESRDVAAAVREIFPSAQVSCDNDTVLKILEDGSVFGISPGETQLTVQAGEQSFQTKLKVKKRGMVYPCFTMMQKEVLDLQFSSGKKVADYDWSSSDVKIAKVDEEGKITAKGVGTAVVTGTARDGSDSYRCEVTVTKRVEKVIYLTFDDGPNRYSTTKILNILKKNDVKATFFELKPAKKDFDLTERILTEGHTLAMHGYQHRYEEIYKSEDTYRENLDKLRDLFFDKFGVWCTLTRFPGGSSNLVSNYNPGIMTKLTKDLDGWGYHYFDWNVSSGDAGGAKNSNQVYRNFKRELSKEHASVVLMHDFYKNDKTIDALERIIKYGKKHGYTFLPLTASTDEVHHRVNN